MMHICRSNKFKWQILPKLIQYVFCVWFFLQFPIAIYSQALKDLTVFAQFYRHDHTGVTGVRPEFEFATDSSASLSKLAKYAPYFKAIGWDGIVSIPGNWFFTPNFATQTYPSSPITLTQEWQQVVNALHSVGMTNHNYVKIPIGYVNGWTDEAHTTRWLLPLWNTEAVNLTLWNNFLTVCDNIGQFAADIGANGFFIDNEKYLNHLLWTYLVEQRDSVNATGSGTTVTLTNLSSLGIRRGTLCRIVLNIESEDPPLYRHQWLAEVQNDGTIQCTTNNYVYPLGNLFQYPTDGIIQSNQNYLIYTEPNVTVTWSGAHGSNGNYFINFGSGLGDDELAHVIYHNETNNRHHEWITKTNTSGGQIVLQKQKERAYFNQYVLVEPSKPTDPDYANIALFGVQGVTEGRYCKISYDKGGAHYKWVSKVDGVINSSGDIKSMSINQWNQVPSQVAPVTFFENPILDIDAITIEPLGGGVTFTGVENDPADDDYYLTGIPNGYPSLYSNMPGVRVIYVNPDNVNQITVWNAKIEKGLTHSKARIHPTLRDPSLSNFTPSTTFYNQGHNKEEFQLCIEFDYNASHLTFYFSLFNLETVRDLVFERGRLMTGSLRSGGVNKVFAVRTESFNDDLGDEFLKGVLAAGGEVHLGNEQSYHDLGFDLNVAHSAINSRFNNESSISFGVSPLQDEHQLLTPQNFETLFSNINTRNSQMNWLYTSGYGKDWYFNSLQTGVDMVGRNPVEFTKGAVGTVGDGHYWLWNIQDPVPLPPGTLSLRTGEKVRVVYSGTGNLYIWDSTVIPGQSGTRNIRISYSQGVPGMAPGQSHPFYNGSWNKNDFHVYRMRRLANSPSEVINTTIARKWLTGLSDSNFKAGDEYHVLYYQSGYDKYYEWKSLAQVSEEESRSIKIEPGNLVTGENPYQGVAPSSFYTINSTDYNNKFNYRVYKYRELDDYIDVLQDGNLTKTSFSQQTEQSNDFASNIPKEFKLFENYPNPFNPSTTIQYDLPKASDVKIFVYNIRGELVRKLVNTTRSAGSYSVSWDGTNDNGILVASGLYIYRFETKDFVISKKMLFLK